MAGCLTPFMTLPGKAAIAAKEWEAKQALCFSLLLQGSGIAHALPLPPKKTFISESELQAARLGGAVPGSESGSVKRSVDRVWTAAVEIGVGVEFGRWLEDRWSEPAADVGTPLRVAQAGGVLPLPPRLMPAFLASSSRSQGGPPSPLDLGAMGHMQTEGGALDFDRLGRTYAYPTCESAQLRGSAISAFARYKRYVTAHELGHAIGCLPPKEQSDGWGPKWLMRRPGTKGIDLDEDERALLHENALGIP